MPFQIGNQLQRKGHQARKETELKRQTLFEYLATGGADAYNLKLNDLANGKELSEPEEQFMDRVERMMEYAKPKLARSEIKADIDTKMDVNIKLTGGQQVQELKPEVKEIKPELTGGDRLPTTQSEPK